MNLDHKLVVILQPYYGCTSIMVGLSTCSYVAPGGLPWRIQSTTPGVRCDSCVRWHSCAGDAEAPGTNCKLHGTSAAINSTGNLSRDKKERRRRETNYARIWKLCETKKRNYERLWVTHWETKEKRNSEVEKWIEMICFPLKSVGDSGPTTRVLPHAELSSWCSTTQLLV